MGVMVIACYRPKPDGEGELLDLMKTHLPILRAEGLVGDEPSLCGRAKDGTIVEVFTWKSQEAIEQAHENPAVIAMWERYAKVCDFMPVGELDEANQLFSPLAPIDLN